MFTYNPSEIRSGGKDQMRFELGDTAVEGGAETCALSDEEYTAFLDGQQTDKGTWQTIKLSLVEAILHKFSFQIDTKVDVLTYDFSSRVEHWQNIYDKLKSEVTANSLPSIGSNTKKPPYFHTSMFENKPPYGKRGR